MVEPKGGTRVISRKDLADLWGVSPNTIDVMRQRGHLKTVATGLFDLDQAQAYRAGQDPSRGMIAKQVNPRGVTPGTKSVDAEADDDTTADAKAAANVLRARATRMAAQAKLSVLGLRKAQGELLDKREIKAATFEAGTVLRLSLEGMARRVGPMAAMRSAEECTALVDRACYEVAEEFTRRMSALLEDGPKPRLEDYWPEPPTGLPPARR